MNQNTGLEEVQYYAMRWYPETVCLESRLDVALYVSLT